MTDCRCLAGCSPTRRPKTRRSVIGAVSTCRKACSTHQASKTGSGSNSARTVHRLSTAGMRCGRPRTQSPLSQTSMISLNQVGRFSPTRSTTICATRSKLGRNGCLDELRQLARYLLSKFGWSEESAVRFVLTGEVPLIPRAQVSVKTFGLSLGSPGAYIRVHLDVDPSVPPEQLTRWFREIRQRLVPGRRRSPVRSERALVDLVHDHPSLTWGERVRQWNSDHPDEKAYPSAQQMARDYHRAIQHALDVRIPWLDGDPEKA